MAPISRSEPRWLADCGCRDCGLVGPLAKRAFLDELMAETGLAEEIRTLGLVGFSVEPLKGPDYSKLISQTSTLDIFVCYGSTWRISNEADLMTLGKTEGTKVRVFLPNPENTALMAQLAQRFDAEGGEAAIRDKVNEAKREFSRIFTGKGKKADFSVWLHDETPVHSFYRFDHVAVVSLYKHSQGRGPVPTFVAERGGSLYDYIEAEVRGMTQQVGDYAAQARKVLP